MPDKKNIPAPYEFENRPIFHRTFGPNQTSVFLPISDARYSLHRLDDISYCAYHIAASLPAGETVLKRAHTNPLESNFSRSMSPILVRRKVHLGAGLRTPDGQRFVKISSMAGKDVGSQTRTFYAVGQVRGSDEEYETLCEEWDHAAWKKKYPDTYQDWLDHLFWATNDQGVPQLPKGRKLETRKGGGLLQINDVSMLPEGWCHRLHRDEKAGVTAYELNNVVLETGYVKAVATRAKAAGSLRDWVPAAYAHLPDPRNSFEPGIPPWLAAGLLHSESPLNSGTYLAPADPLLPSFTGTPPSDARALNAARPSTAWCDSVLRPFSKNDRKLGHLELPKRMKAEDKVTRRVLSPSVDSSSSPSPEVPESTSSSGSDSDAHLAVRARKRPRTRSSFAVVVESSAEVDTSQARLVQLLGQMSRDDILAALATHAAGDADFDSELVMSRMAGFSVTEMAMVENATQARLEALASEGEHVNDLHFMRLAHAEPLFQGSAPKPTNTAMDDDDTLMDEGGGRPVTPSADPDMDTGNDFPQFGFDEASSPVASSPPVKRGRLEIRLGGSGEPDDSSSDSSNSEASRRSSREGVQDRSSPKLPNLRTRSRWDERKIRSDEPAQGISDPYIPIQRWSTGRIPIPMGDWPGSPASMHDPGARDQERMWFYVSGLPYGLQTNLLSEPEVRKSLLVPRNRRA